jgi:hypothetical protein
MISKYLSFFSLIFSRAWSQSSLDISNSSVTSRIDMIGSSLIQRYHLPSHSSLIILPKYTLQILSLIISWTYSESPKLMNFVRDKSLKNCYFYSILLFSFLTAFAVAFSWISTDLHPQYSPIPLTSIFEWDESAVW